MDTLIDDCTQKKLAKSSNFFIWVYLSVDFYVYELYFGAQGTFWGMIVFDDGSAYTLHNTYINITYLC